MEHETIHVPTASDAKIKRTPHEHSCAYAHVRYNSTSTTLVLGTCGVQTKIPSFPRIQEDLPRSHLAGKHASRASSTPSAPPAVTALLTVEAPSAAAKASLADTPSMAAAVVSSARDGHSNREHTWTRYEHSDTSCGA